MKKIDQIEEQREQINLKNKPNGFQIQPFKPTLEDLHLRIMVEEMLNQWYFY